MLGSRGFPLALSWELSPLSGGLTLELVQNEAERGFGCLQHHPSSFWGVGGGFSTAPLLPAAGRGLGGRWAERSTRGHHEALHGEPGATLWGGEKKGLGCALCTFFPQIFLSLQRGGGSPSRLITVTRERGGDQGVARPRQSPSSRGL